LDGAAFGACSSPKGYSGLAVGSHTFQVRSSANGQTGSPASQSWSITAPAPGGDTSAPDGTVMVGNTGIETQRDSNVSGRAEAFLTTAAASGTMTSLRIYLDSASTASSVVLGIYSDDGGHPGSLLGQAAVAAPKAGSWNSAALPQAVLVTAGDRYWIAVLATGSGKIQFRDRGTGGQCETSGTQNLSSLPATWKTGKRYDDSPISAFGVS
jgi:hypothetical protein